MGQILIIDDDSLICETLADAVQEQGHQATCALTLSQGLREARSHPYDVVFLDVLLPDGNGLEALPAIRETAGAPEIIILTACGDLHGPELAIKNGAWDYLQKPSSQKEILLPLLRALQYRREKTKKQPLALKLEGIIGRSPGMRACYDLLAQAAHLDTNVLITGETGTGKELFARAIHGNSSRALGKFVVVDCTVIPENLVASTLFGFERGAFTGAEKAQEGLIKQADGGTLFMDEVGELPLPMQKAFLRVLHERCFRPLGGKRELSSDFRLIAATNRNLEEMVAQGQFRGDLLFRLRGLTIELPPLRQRTEDIMELVLYYLARLCEQYEIGTKGLSPEFLDTLAAYGWPGNVRELMNALERALAVAEDEPTLYPQHLPPHIRIQVTQDCVSRQALATSSLNELLVEMVPRWKDFLAEKRRQYVQLLLAHTGRDLQAATRLSGLSRSSLYEYFKKYRVDPEKSR